MSISCRYAVTSLSQASVTRPALSHCSFLRTFATTSSASQSHDVLTHAGPSIDHAAALRQRFALDRRSLSLFGPITRPLREARLARKAAATPEDAASARAFYEQLLARPKPAYDIIVGDFEGRTSLFKPAAADAKPSVLLADQNLFTLYLRALANSTTVAGQAGPAEKLAAALQKRKEKLGVSSTASSAAVASTASPSLTDTLASAVVARRTGQEAKVNGSTISATPTGSSTAGAATSTIRVEITDSKSNKAWSIFRFVLGFVLWTFLLLTIFSLIMDTSSNAIKAVAGAAGQGPTAVQPDQVAHRVSFDDVQGCEEAKEELKEIVDFLKDPTKFSRLGGRLPRGVLLTGPPGTGKTLLARAVAGEAGVNMFICSGSEFDEVFVGVGAKRVRELFDTARKNSPAVVFIDELDAVGGKRSTRDMQHMKQTLNQLLVEMDGFTPSDHIVVIGATNIGDALDSALTRPGRFDRHVPVPLPDVRGRLAILRRHTKAVEMAADVDLTDLARGTPGMSGAELENLINSAAIKASVDGLDSVPVSAFEWAKDKILMGAERKSAVITPESKLMTAYHEAGHALAAYYNEDSDPVHKVTVLPRGHALGITFRCVVHWTAPLTHTGYRRLTATRCPSCNIARIWTLRWADGQPRNSSTARTSAPMLFAHSSDARRVTSGASSDIKNATQTANHMIRDCGFSDKVGIVSVESESPQTRALVDSEVREYIDQAYSRAMDLLKSRRSELELVARALVERETLTGDELDTLIKTGRLPAISDL